MIASARFNPRPPRQPPALAGRASPDSRAGFSVLEAIVVLAITSLVLVLVFSIGSRATQTGFRLGRRALGVADAQVDAESLRAVLDGVLVPPPHRQGTVLPDLQGARDRFSFGASFPRATSCAPAGPAGIVTLALARTAARTVLSCGVGGALAPLVDLGARDAAISYSLDGASWTESLSLSGVGAGAAAENVDPRVAFSEARRLWVRVATSDGSFQVVEALSSGRPPPPSPSSSGS